MIENEITYRNDRKSSQWTDEDAAIFEKTNYAGWTVYDGYADAYLMDKLSAMKGVPPASKIIVMTLAEIR